MASHFVKPTISQQAREYVLCLGREQVTSRQKHVLMAIAENYSERYGEAIMEMDTLCEYVLVTRRRMRDILAALDHLIEYFPGLGAGNFCRFRFREFQIKKEAEKGKERGRKEEVSDTPNKEEDLNPDLNLNQKPTAFDSDLQQSKKESQEREGSAKTPPSQYSQSDFDERDLRLLAGAFRKFDKMQNAAIGAGNNWTLEKYYGWLSLESGLSPRRIREIEEGVGWYTRGPNPVANEAECLKHPESGLTRWGTCLMCWTERKSSDLRKEPQRAAG